MRSYDVLMFGGYFCDLIITGLPELPRLGLDLFGTGMGLHAGGTFNTVRALHRLGMRVGWVCDFGDDLFSQFVLSEIHQEGVDTSLFRYHDRPVRWFSLAFSFAGDRGFISYIDPVEPYDRIPYVLDYKPGCILLGSLEYGPEMMELVDAARRVGALVYMDCQATPATLKTPGVVETLRSIDAFLPNASEAVQITGAANVEQAADILSAMIPLVVIKLGPEGALARTKDCKFYSPALDVEVVDTTGAGDCFNAGFLYSHLRDQPVEISLRAGNICGGLSTTTSGTGAAPSEEEIKKYLQLGGDALDGPGPLE